MKNGRQENAKKKNSSTCFIHHNYKAAEEHRLTRWLGPSRPADPAFCKEGRQIDKTPDKMR